MSSSSASSAAVILALLVGPAAAVPCDIEAGEVPLFMCETDPPGHFLSICAVEVKKGEAWSEVQYRLSSNDEIEFVYPEEFSQGIAQKLFFSHEKGADGYIVSVRFVSDGTRYRLTSTAKSKTDGHADIMVENTPRPSMTKISCGERPAIFPDYLRRALTCDPDNSFRCYGLRRGAARAEIAVPLQNRVTPWGELVATPERGTMLGNRGGKFHREDQTLGRRRWASHHWIACELHYKGMHHEPMGKGYTSLFFLDEVTALAAGHRPCFFCRRQDAKRFMALEPDGLKLDGFDRALHAERQGPRQAAELEGLPDGTMVAIGDEAFAVRGQSLLHWSPGGYLDVRKRKAAMPSLLLTPSRIIAIVARGYRPRWHPSAEALIGGDE